MNYSIALKEKKILVVSEPLPPVISGDGIRAVRNSKSLSEFTNIRLLTRTRQSISGLSTIVFLPNFFSNEKKFLRILNKLINISILPVITFARLMFISKPHLLHVYSVNWFSIYIILFNRLVWRSKLLTEITLMGSDTVKSTTRWWLYRKLTDFCLNSSDQINCISSLLYYFMHKNGFPKEKLSLIHNSVDSRFLPVSPVEKNSLRKKLNFDEKEFLVITVGGILKRKGYLLIKEIITKMEPGTPVSFLAVGSFEQDHQKELMMNIKNKLKEKGLEEKLLFLGYTDPLPYLQCSDVYLFASDREGFSSALIEAMGAGLPAICRRLPGITEDMVEDGVSGFIIDSDEPEKFIQAILQLYNNKQLLNSMGTKARETSQKKFSMEKIRDEYISIYKQLLNE